MRRHALQLLARALSPSPLPPRHHPQITALSAWRFRGASVGFFSSDAAAALGGLKPVAAAEKGAGSLGSRSKRTPGSLSEFHQDLIGLTGTTDEIRQVARAYRVYYMRQMRRALMYLNMRTEFGKFFGKNYNADSLADGIIKEIREHKSS